MEVYDCLTAVRTAIELRMAQNPDFHNAIEPQSLFDIGLDMDTREFISGAVNDIRGILNDKLKIEHGASEEFVFLGVRLANAVEILLDIGAMAFAVYALSEGNGPMIVMAAALVLYRFESIQAKLKSVFERVRGVQPESIRDTSLYILGAGMLWKLIEGAGYCATFEDTYDYALLNMRKVLNDNQLRSMDNFLSFVQMCLDKVCVLLTGKECPFSFIGKSSQKVRKLLEELAELEVSRSSNTIALDELVIKLEDLMKELEIESKSLDKGSTLFIMSTQTLTKCRSILVEVRALLKADCGNRQEPVCYFFVGPPGCGKTSFNEAVTTYFVMSLSSDYMKESYKRDPEAIYRQVHAFDQTDQYYSGYRNQPVVIIDEADPQPAAVGLVATPPKIIRLVNTTACPLNMADLGSKGTTFFNSKIILGTTNTYNWSNLPGVSDPNAFYRRVTFVTISPNVDMMRMAFAKQLGITGAVSATYEQLRPLMHEHMHEVAARFHAGSLDLGAYLDECYKYTIFRVNVLSDKSSKLTSTSGYAIKPSELIRRIVSEANRKRDHAVQRSNMARSVMDDYNKNHPAIKAQSFLGLGSLRDLVTNRYSGETWNADEKKARHTAAGTFARNNFSPEVIKQGLFPEAVRCGCELCSLFLNSENAQRTAVRAVELHRHGRIPQVEMHNLVEEMHRVVNDEELGLDYSRYSKPCQIPGGDSAQECFVNVYRFCSNVNWLLAKKHMENIDKLSRGVFFFKRLAKDIAIAGAVIGVMKFAYDFVSSRKDHPAQGVYPMRPKKDTKGKRSVMTIRVHDIQAQGGPEDMLYAFVTNNVYRFKIRSEKDVGLSSHLTMVQNRLALIPAHVAAGVCEIYERDPDAYMEVFGCIQTKKGAPSFKRQTIPLSSLIHMDNDSISWFGGVTEVCPRFRCPFTDRLVQTDMVLVTVPLTGRSYHEAFFGEGFFEKDVNHVQRVGSIALLGDHETPEITKTYMAPVEHWQEIRTDKWYDEAIDDRSVREVGENTHWYGTKLIKYSADTEVGNCGAPVFMKYNGVLKVAGIHVAGAKPGGWGYAVHVTKEDLAKAIQRHVTEGAFPSPTTTVLVEPPIQRIVQESDFVIGSGGKGHFGHQVLMEVKAPSIPRKSNILKSPLYNKVKGPDTHPALLTPKMVKGELVDPMEVAQDGYGEVEVCPVTPFVSLIMDNMWASMAQQAPLPGEKYIPTWEEAVCPGPLFEFVRSIPRNTSAGYPYCLQTGGKRGKLAWFGDGVDYSFTSREWYELVAEMEGDERKILNHERPLFMNMSFLKDERRPYEKYVAGKTRLISGSSLRFTILLRKYTMGFFNYLIRTRAANGVAIGTNPYSEDWDNIARYHGYFTENDRSARTMAGDFSGFDKKLHYVFIMATCDLVTKFYGDEGSDAARIRRALFSEIAFSRHVVGSEVVEWIGSNTSGNAMTTPINSLSNQAMTRYVCVMKYLEHNNIEINKLHFMLTLDKLFNPLDPWFANTTFGDDGLISILVEITKELEWFTPGIIASAFTRHLGAKYTDEFKAEAGGSLRHISDCTFLKRGFKMSGIAAPLKGRFMAPLEVNSILDSVRWRKNSPDTEGLSEWAANVRHMVEELSLHDPKTYQEIGGAIVAACNTLDRRPPELPLVLEDQELAQVKCTARELEY